MCKAIIIIIIFFFCINPYLSTIKKFYPTGSALPRSYLKTGPNVSMIAIFSIVTVFARNTTISPKEGRAMRHLTQVESSKNMLKTMILPVHGVGWFKIQIHCYFILENCHNIHVVLACKKMWFGPLNPFPNDKFWTLLNSKSLQTTISDWMKMPSRSPNGWKT